MAFFEKQITAIFQNTLFCGKMRYKYIKNEILSTWRIQNSQDM